MTNDQDQQVVWLQQQDYMFAIDGYPKLEYLPHFKEKFGSVFDECIPFFQEEDGTITERYKFLFE